MFFVFFFIIQKAAGPISWFCGFWGLFLKTLGPFKAMSPSVLHACVVYFLVLCKGLAIKKNIFQGWKVQILKAVLFKFVSQRKFYFTRSWFCNLNRLETKKVLVSDIGLRSNKITSNDYFRSSATFYNVILYHCRPNIDIFISLY